MPESKNGPKHLYDLAKALGRWDDEGGAAASSGPGPALHAAEERVVRCLGAAVIMQWNDLPTEIQRKLFEAAASMKKPRTTVIDAHQSGGNLPDTLELTFDP